MIDAGETPYPGKVGKGVGRCSCDGKELFFCRGEHDAGSEDHCAVAGFSCFIWESVKK